jgi:hypothetical protein
MRIFAENETCAVTSRLVFMDNQEHHLGFKPDYSIFTDPQNHPVVTAARAAKKKYLINKDGLGHDRRKHECGYDLFPDAVDYLAVKPAVLFWDPVRIFDSWKAMGWGDLGSLTLCMAKLEQMLEYGASFPIIYERFVLHPETETRALCSWWNVPFEDTMLSFQKTSADFPFHGDRERAIYCEPPPSRSV